MRKFKLVTTVLLLSAMFVGFNACSDDDDKDKEENYIVGRWKVMEEGATDEMIEYKSDGTFKYYYADEEENETGKYKIESEKLYQMWDEDDVADWSIYKIHELNSISLIIEEYNSDGNLSGYKESFQRK